MTTPPAPDPTPPPDLAAAPPPTESDLERFIASLASFDPAALEQRLQSLVDRASQTDVAQSVKDALEGPLGELTSAVKALTRQVKGTSATPAPDPVAPPTPAAPPAAAPPAADPPVPVPPADPPANGGGLLGAIFGGPPQVG